MVRRELILKSIVMIAITVVLLSAAPVKADLTSASIDEIAYYRQGIPETLSNSPDYAWWYGCSPTSAGMMMGYYDINGYQSLIYDNLVPGGTAEPETFVGPPTGGSALANQAIASAGHITDYYSGANGASGDDLPAAPTHSFNSLADFMGTSQDLYSNPNGSTVFGYWPNGDPVYEASSGAGEGMYGVGQYVEYAGYDAATLYNQLIPGVADLLWFDNHGNPIYESNENGFTFDNYMTEIDAGRPVMIQVAGHSMFGYGYDEGISDLVYVHDTWGLGGGTMTWGGSYAGRLHYGVMVLEITGGVVPVPAAVLLGILGLGVVGIKLRRFA